MTSKALFSVALALLVALTSAPAIPSLAQRAAAAPTSPLPSGLRLPDLTQPYLPGRIIVGYDPALTPSLLGLLRSKAGATQSRLLLGGVRRVEMLTLSAGETVAGAVKRLWGLPGVRYVEPDYMVTSLVESNDPEYEDSGLWGVRGPSSTPPSLYGSRADEVWADGEIGSSSVYVGIIDEGIDVSHPDLAGNIWTNPFDPVNGRDDDGNGYVDDVHGWDFFNDDNSVYDGGGNDEHGTHVAGTIGAVGGNGLGVAGVNWDVTMIAAKFLGPSGGAISDAVDAVKYLTDLKRRHNINIVASSNSWGGGGFSQALEDAINEGGDEEILFIAAAGNSGTNNDASPSYPSNLECTRRANGSARGWDCVVAVAAIDANGNLASFSQYGATSVDLGAPGVNVLSTVPGSRYEAFDGTSMATPHVSGAAALCASQDAAITGLELKNAMLASSTPTSSLTGKVVTGSRLNAADLMAMCAAVVAPMTGALTGVSGAAKSRSSIELSWVDGVANETYFEIQRAPTTRRGCSTSFATVGYVGRNETSFIDTGLVVNTTYCYQMRSYSRYGGGSNSSWTAVQTATTLPRPDSISCSATTYAWVEPAGGTSLSLGDDQAALVELPFDFNFYGVDYSSLFVAANGIIGITSSSSIEAHVNTAVGVAANPNGFVAPHWDDLVQGFGSQIRVTTSGDPGSQVTAVSWVNMRHFTSESNGSSTITFQALLHEADGVIVFNYQDLDFANPAISNARSATVGMEDEVGDVSTRISVDGSTPISSLRSYRCAPPPPPSAPASVTAPSIVGVPAVGVDLTANLGAFTGNPRPDTQLTWYRCSEATSSEPTEVPAGCTSVSARSSYRVTGADVGYAIRVGVLASNSLGTTRRLSAGAAVPLVAPVNSRAPEITGFPRIGAALTANAGTWEVAGESYAYQWYACTTSDRRSGALPPTCTAIAGAETAELTLGGPQLGRFIRVLVTATNTAGSTSALSVTTEVVATPPAAPSATRLPRISGTARVGRSISVQTGTWSSTERATYAYQWFRCTASASAATGTAGGGCSAIAGATGARYTVQAADIGKYLRVTVTAINSGGSGNATTSTTSLIR